MIKAAALFLAIALSSCATAPEASHDIVLPSAFRDGAAFIQVSVNGAPPRWMGLDDGTSPSVLDLDYAKSLGLTLKPGAGAGTGFGTQKIQFFNTVVDIASGDATRSHVDFSAAPLTGMTGPDGQPLAGVVGYSLLKDRILVIDYKAATIAFVASSERRDSDIPMGMDNLIPTVPITVAGHTLSALIDTGGAYELLVTPKGVAAAGLQAYVDQAQRVTGYGYAGAQAVRIGSAPDVTVGPFSHANPVTVYSTFGTAPLKSQAAIGYQFLRHYRVTLNYRARTVRLEP